MKVTAKVLVDAAALRRIQTVAEAALPKMLDALQTEIQSRGVVPKADGTLEGSIFAYFAGRAGGIGWDTPYARYQFYGMNRHTGYTTPLSYSTAINANAQARWTDYWQYGEGKAFLPKSLMYFLKADSGGLVT